MARMVTKDSIFGEGDSYSFRIAIRLGQIERVSKFIKERYSTVNLGGLLHYALSYDQIEIVRLLITKFECSVDCRNESNETPLHYACKEGNVAAVRVLISQHKADMNALDSQNFTPLDSAARSGQTDVMKCLIDEFNCSLIGNRGIAILQITCFAGHVDLAETLIAHYNLDPTSVDDNGNSPLHFAATICGQEMLSLLITKYKCPVDCKNCTNETPLHWACQKVNTRAVRILVSKYNADLTAHCMGNSTPLNEAALNGHTDVVKCLIDEFGCSINVKDDQNKTILHSACREGHTDLVETLLSQYSLDPLSIDEDGNTPLHTAASKGQKKVVNLLLSKYNCPVDRRNNTNQTPLHCACSRGDLGTIKMLIMEHKADLYALDERGNTPAMVAALEGKSEAVKSLIDEFGYDPNSKRYDGRTLLHQACISGDIDQVEVLITCYSLDPVAVDDNGNTPLHLATLNGNEEMVKVLITKYQCPVNCRNMSNELPLDLALANGHQNIVNLLKKGELETDKDLLPMILREGYICAAQNSICIVQTPSDIPISVVIDSVDDVTLHPKLHAREFLLTPIVRISSDTNEFCPNKQAVVELLKTTELHDCEYNPIPMFSDTQPSQPPRWRDLNPDDFEVLQDRIVFNTTHFSLFTVIARLPTPTNSVTVTRNEDQEPIELTLSEVSNVKVVIPPSSIKSESAETEIKITANFDHPSLCDESVDATACITLEPHGLEFKERISIRIPIPDYAQIRKTYSNAKLQFLHSNDPLDSECASWMVIPEGEYEIVKEDGEYVGIVYSTHFSNRKAVWLNIPKKIKRKIQGPIHEFRRCIAKKALKSFSGRCQVFMSSETVIGSLLNFSIAALLHPLQEFHEIPKNYYYMLYDSEKTPMTVKGSSLRLTVELADYCSSKESKIFCEEVELSGDFSARADFNIALDSNALFVDGAVLGKLSIEHGQGKGHKVNLIKPRKAAIMKHIPENQSNEGITTSSANPKGRKATAEEPEVIVYVPSLDSTALLKPKDISSVSSHLWPARHKWRRIGMAVEINPTTLEVIQMDNRRTDDCFNEMLTKWLRNNKPLPCWKNLTSALQSVEIKVLDSTVCLSEESVEKPPVHSPRKRPPVPLPGKIATTPVPMKKPPLPQKQKSFLAKQAIAAAVHQLNTSLNRWGSNVVTEVAKTIANYTEQMAEYVRDDYQDAEIVRDDFAVLAGSIVYESDKLITIGLEVANVCTNKTLKKVMIGSKVDEYIYHIRSIRRCSRIVAAPPDVLKEIVAIIAMATIL